MALFCNRIIYPLRFNDRNEAVRREVVIRKIGSRGDDVSDTFQVEVFGRIIIDDCFSTMYFESLFNLSRVRQHCELLKYAQMCYLPGFLAIEGGTLNDTKFQLIE